MTAALVLDASAAIALVRREPSRSEIAAHVRPRREGGPCLVPDFFWIELANVLIRRHRFGHADLVAALRDMDELGLASVRLDRATLLVAIDVAARLGLAVYDAAYLALAEVEDARLLTLDRTLAEAAGPRAIRLESLGPSRLAETPAPYESEPVDWARFGDYLAKLRAEARAS